MEDPKDVPASFFHWWRQHVDLILRGHKLAEICELSLEKPEFAIKCRSVEINVENKFYSRFVDTTSAESMGRVLVTTDGGCFGMGPGRAQPGDEICVLLGCSIPLVIRRNGEEFELIGECYLKDFMNGEAIEMVKGGSLGYEKIRLV